NNSINKSRLPGCNVYCRTSTFGQQICGDCASGFSMAKPCAATGTVAIRNFNARNIDILKLHHPPTMHRKPLTIDEVQQSIAILRNVQFPNLSPKRFEKEDSIKG